MRLIGGGRQDLSFSGVSIGQVLLDLMDGHKWIDSSCMANESMPVLGIFSIASILFWGM